VRGPAAGPGGPGRGADPERRGVGATADREAGRPAPAVGLLRGLPNEDGTTHLDHGERYSGILVALAKGSAGTNNNSGDDAFSQALKQRAESVRESLTGATAQTGSVRLGILNEVILWATFAGAWLLVAGPLYQGSVELGELDFDRDLTVSRERQQPSQTAQLTHTQREQMARLQSKSAGWFTVAAGATLLAAGETWQIVRHYDWPA
jgi:hypothetical protein